ncbi:MAG: pyrroline-5-carboxylate reductase [Rhizobiales bacterium NRL2]|jgi:pyrroline-5-carboxylate reductase|nr:MAG: pyrroline-5-carboxylate reductase [Rhizobiales bacterium NRL2]
MANGRLLVGCGKMGGAMLDGWLARGTDPETVVIVEPAEAAQTALKAKGVTVVSSADDVPDGFAPDCVILAVKPQMMADVAPAYARFRSPATQFLSIAAGTTIGFFEGALGGDAAIVRTMPNTPAAVGKGMIVACPNPNVTEAMKTRAGELLAAVGEVAWVEDEGQMDAVTAVSGSGPAYVFHMIECLAAAGEAAGLPAELSARLALQTVYGAGCLARDADDGPAQLRVNVTSPGGTTEAALKVLMAEGGLKPLMEKAVLAARDRGRELGG